MESKLASTKTQEQIAFAWAARELGATPGTSVFLTEIHTKFGSQLDPSKIGSTYTMTAEDAQILELYDLDPAMVLPN